MCITSEDLHCEYNILPQEYTYIARTKYVSQESTYIARTKCVSQVSAFIGEESMRRGGNSMKEGVREHKANGGKKDKHAKKTK